MINANELRVGNWVSNGAPLKVVGYMLVNQSFEGDDFNFYIGFYSIPITPEILEKCSEKIGENTYRIFIKGTDEILFINYYTDKELVYSLFSFGTSKNIRSAIYLHQLQNLYFALTGEELNIEL